MDKKQQKELQRKQEDTALVRALIWAACAVILELILILINRRYFDITISPEAIATAQRIQSVLEILLVAAPVAALALVVFALVTFQKSGRLNPWLSCALGVAAIGLCAHFMVVFQQSGMRLLYFIVPACGALAMVYYLYQREFFLIGVFTGPGAVSLWLVRHRGGAANVWVYTFIALTLVLAVVGIALLVRMDKQGGACTVMGRKVQVVSPGGGYRMPALTAAINAVCVVLALLFGGQVAYYLIFALAAWLFAMLVYHTVKLM